MFYSHLVFKSLSFQAVVKGYGALVEYLINGAKIAVDSVDEWGFTARDYAEKRGLLDIIKILSDS